MKQTLTLESVSTRQAKNGKTYSVYRTSEGEMSCFDKLTIEALSKNVGAVIECEVEKVGEFTNLRKFYKVIETPTEHIKDTKEDKRSMTEKNCELICAKDLYGIEMGYRSVSAEDKMTREALMELCCDLIKQARKELENG